MAKSPAQALLEREMRVSYRAVPHTLDGVALNETSWHLAGEEFLMRLDGDRYIHYRKGEGVSVERAGAEFSDEALWLSGSVYSAVACINGFLPIHASAVCHAGRVYAFTGPSGAGKSTLVSALGHRGLPLFCDDTLVLDLSDPDTITCLPGHKRLKLSEQALGLTGAEQEEKVAADIAKFYARPPHPYEGGPLPLAELIFLEEGAPAAIEPVRGGARIMRLQDDHYTAMHFAAARQLDPASHFQHLVRLAGQMEISRFARPMDAALFEDSLAMAYDHIAHAASSNAERT